jgi:ABC-type dipeptide/oligopeptide/nickel transport system permease component
VNAVAGSETVRRHRSQYVIRRTAAALLMVLAALVLNFFLFRALPGDASDSFGAIPQATPELRQQVREEFGLDQSLATQFVKYLEQLPQGHLGISTVDRRPVAEKLGDALVNTLPLMIGAVVVATIAGVLLGTLAAWRHGGVVDPATTSLALALNALPVQWLGLMLIILLSGSFASGGIHDPFLVGASTWERALDYLEHLALPMLTLTLSLYGTFVVIARTAVLETLGDDYILVARAKGLSTTRVLRRYALRNAMLPTATLIALTLGYVVGGAVLVETVFSWPGLGRAMYDAVADRDYPMLQGAFLLLTLSVVVFTYLADLLYMWLDPRITDGA